MFVTATRREQEVAENAAMAAMIAGKLDEAGMLEIPEDFEGIVRSLACIAITFKPDARKTENDRLKDFVAYTGDQLLGRYGVLV